MTKPLTTYYEFPLIDGTTVKMSLSFYSVYQLKSFNKDLYRRYNDVFVRMNDKKYQYDELDNLTILYAAYVCANISDENRMTEEEFLMMLFYFYQKDQVKIEQQQEWNLKNYPFIFMVKMK